MKKAITVIAAFALTAALSLNAFAAEGPTTADQTDNPKNVDVTVKTDIAPTYTVTIPADAKIEFNALSTPFGSIELTKAQLEPGKVIQVSVAAGALKNEADTEKTLPYTVKSAGERFIDDVYTAAGQKTGLTLEIEQSDWDAAPAGAYTGTVTFTVAYVPAE